MGLTSYHKAWSIYRFCSHALRARDEKSVLSKHGVIGKAHDHGCCFKRVQVFY
jgi:hypothetical protein